jgi:hypothetical protein
MAFLHQLASPRMDFEVGYSPVNILPLNHTDDKKACVYFLTHAFSVRGAHFGSQGDRRGGNPAEGPLGLRDSRLRVTIFTCVTALYHK